MSDPDNYWERDPCRSIIAVGENSRPTWRSPPVGNTLKVEFIYGHKSYYKDQCTAL